MAACFSSSNKTFTKKEMFDGLNQMHGIWEEMLQCAICQSTYKDPVALKCLHSFCKPCIDLMVQTLNTRKIRCPTCRETTLVYKNTELLGPVKNWFIQDLADKVKKTQELLLRIQMSDTVSNYDGLVKCTDHDYTDTKYVTVCKDCLSEMWHFVETAGQFTVAYDKDKNCYKELNSYVYERYKRIQNIIESCKSRHFSHQQEKLEIRIPIKSRPSEKPQVVKNKTPRAKLSSADLNSDYRAQVQTRTSNIKDRPPTPRPKNMDGNGTTSGSNSIPSWRERYSTGQRSQSPLRIVTYSEDEHDGEYQEWLQSLVEELERIVRNANGAEDIENTGQDAPVVHIFRINAQTPTANIRPDEFLSAGLNQFIAENRREARGSNVPVINMSQGTLRMTTPPQPTKSTTLVCENSSQTEDNTRGQRTTPLSEGPQSESTSNESFFSKLFRRRQTSQSIPQQGQGEHQDAFTAMGASNDLISEASVRRKEKYGIRQRFFRQILTTEESNLTRDSETAHHNEAANAASANAYRHGLLPCEKSEEKYMMDDDLD